MLEAIQQSMESRRLADGVRKALLAVSGGSDSMAMLRALQQLWRPLGIEITVWHLDHGLRGTGGAEDARLVASYSEHLGLPCIRRSADVPRLAAASPQSMEMTARTVRYDRLQADARTLAADCICTGHTADDQIETLFLRWGRGCGPRGLGGIQPRSGGAGRPVLLRPLLDCRRKDLRDWLRREGVPWRDDPTNSDMGILRNRVRNLLVPAFEETFGRSAVPAALRSAALISDEECTWLEPMVQEALQAARTPRGLDVRSLRTLARPLARRVMLRWLQRQGLAPGHQSYATLERALTFGLAAPAGTRLLSLGGGIRLRRRYDLLDCIGRLPSAGDDTDTHGVADSAHRPQPACSTAYPLTLPPPDALAAATRCDAPALGLQVRLQRALGVVRDVRHSPLEPPHECTLPWRMIKGRRLVLRAARPGDRIRPLGAPGARKISDLLIDLKIPRDDRAGVPVLLCDDEVVWLPGVAVAGRYAVPGPDEPVLKLRLSARPRAVTQSPPIDGASPKPSHPEPAAARLR